MDDVTAARALHVLAVIHWFGGVAFVTTVVLPAVASAPAGAGLAQFEAIEQRFAAQVRISVPLAGLTGAYMAERLDLWPRFLEPGAWWLGAMALVWLVFMAILFVVEPLLLRGWFARAVELRPAATLGLIRRAHWLLLAVGGAVAAAAVLGAHGALA